MKDLEHVLHDLLSSHGLIVTDRLDKPEECWRLDFRAKSGLIPANLLAGVFTESIEIIRKMISHE